MFSLGGYLFSLLFAGAPIGIALAGATALLVLFDDFLPGVQAAVGSAEGVTLCQKGKNWSYDSPSYSEEEKDFIFATIFERLFEVGVINKGLSNGKSCFCITAFGFQAMGLED